MTWMDCAQEHFQANSMGTVIAMLLLTTAIGLVIYASGLIPGYGSYYRKPLCRRIRGRRLTWSHAFPADPAWLQGYTLASGSEVLVEITGEPRSRDLVWLLGNGEELSWTIRPSSPGSTPTGSPLSNVLVVQP